MRLLQIRYFLTIADMGNITQAAQQLYVSQPALSKQIRLLENEIGAKLLQRTPRGVILTPAGEQFAKDCRKILTDLDAAAKRAASFEKVQKRTFRIGCFDGAYIDDFMPDLYRNLREKDPNLQIQLSRKSIGENRKALKEDRIDLLIDLRFPTESLSEDSKEYENKILVKRRGALIYSKVSPLAEIKSLQIRDFTSQPLLLSDNMDNKSMESRALEELCSIGLTDQRVEYADNFVSLMSNLSMGHGFALLAVDVAENNPALQAFPLPEQFGICVTAVWKHSNQLACSMMKPVHS